MRPAYLPAEDVEDGIVRNHATLALPAGFADEVNDELTQALEDEQQITAETKSNLVKQLARLDAAEERLIDLAVDKSLPTARIRERLSKIHTDRKRLQESLAHTTAQLAVGAHALGRALDLAAQPQDLYRRAPDDVRRQMNQTFYERFYIDGPGVVIDVVLNPPFNDLHAAARASVQMKARARPTTDPAVEATPSRARSLTRTNGGILLAVGSSKAVVVELRGFEPLTPSMRTRCATGLRHSPRRGGEDSKAAPRARTGRSPQRS